jgi:FkbM family methyltransferase
MKDYSQSREQGIILDYFGYRFENGSLIVSPRMPCTVLDIGANDGITLSNSRALVELEWNSVLVEPSEITFRKLVENNVATFTIDRPFSEAKFIIGKWARKDGTERTVTCVQAAIAQADAPLTFYDSGTHLKKGDTSLLSTTRPEELARWKKSGEVFTKTTVRGITVATLLNETGLERADFISIDCEGVDLSVLQQLDLTALQTRMVCVEVNQSPEAPFMEYLTKHGFRKHFRNFENLIAVKA